MVRLRTLAVFLLALATAACSDDDDDDTVPLPDDDDDTVDDDDDDDTTPETVDGPFVRLHPDGRLDWHDSEDAEVLRGGWAEALVEIDDRTITLSSRDCQAEWDAADALAPLSGEFHRYGRVCELEPARFEWEVWEEQGDGRLVVLLHVRANRPLTVMRLTPLMTEGEAGGLFLGGQLRRHRILDDGSNIALDVEANLHYPDEPRLALLDGLIPIPVRGNVISNWNHAIADLDAGRSLVAGALAVERAFPLFGTIGSDPGAEDPQPDADRFWAWYADQPMLFEGKPLETGTTLDAEPIYLDAFSPDPWTGLERYADTIAEWQPFTVWTRREGGRPVPNGWNSWTGSGGTGGLGTDINEEILQENLEVMAREFEPFGVDYFQIDDGYQQADGDWVERADRFPSGMAALAQRIRDRGLKPGIWISALTVDDSSQLAAQHPDWRLPPENNLLGGLLSPGEGKSILDPSNPEAIAWLRDTMARYKADWGMEWIKLDFAYLALPYRPKADPSLTSMEAYKRAIRALREELGDDAFYLGVALMGVNWGVVDSMRLTLDNGPRWAQQQPFALLGDGNNFQSTVKTGARRYYFHNRVWLTHNDLLFFRTDSEHPDPPVTLQEAVTFASFIGLTGSLVKFGEDLRTLTPEQIGIWRRLLPSYPAAARPLDLFTRHYPEVYHLPIRGTAAGSDARWEVVGLLNWGRNFDFDADGEPAEMADTARIYRIPLADLGLDPEAEYLAREFWSGEFLGSVRGTLEQAVEAHGHAVIALRERLDHPQFLGTNRHFTQGATDLAAEAWDEVGKTLRIEMPVDQGGLEAVPFEYRLAIHVPEGWELEGPTEADTTGAAIEPENRIYIARFTPSSSGRTVAVLEWRFADPLR